MKVLKPSWVNHDGCPIFSIDVHPDDTKFATGGQGIDNVGRVAIWSTKPILQDEDDDKNPKLLCQLDHHNACVNCVRWSQSGDLLASGGDDKLIIIWKLVSKSFNGPINSAFGKTNYEQWKVVIQLSNHRGDVLDLAWSPNDKYLASASVDNTAIVWNAQNLPQIVYVLKGHTSLVKGVSWDPIGKYLATQSDDKSLKIWRTSDWQLEKDIREPFTECGGTTHVLRLGWSPDGFYIVSAHAMNDGGPTAQIIEREEWKSDKDFVGHRKAVVCARFCKNLATNNVPTVQGGGKNISYVAIGSRDKSISVWTTALKRPVLVLKDTFTNSVMDLSWSSSGRILLGCSCDGTIVVIKFEGNEIGTPISAEEKEQMFNKHYGKNVMSSCEIVQDLDVFIAKKNIEAEAAETTNILNQQSILKKPEMMRQTSEASNDALLIKGPIDRQIETRTAEGKRRITPKFILPNSVNSNDSLVVQSSSLPSNQLSNSNISEMKDKGQLTNGDISMDFPSNKSKQDSGKRKENAENDQGSSGGQGQSKPEKSTVLIQVKSVGKKGKTPLNDGNNTSIHENGIAKKPRLESNTPVPSSKPINNIVKPRTIKPTTLESTSNNIGSSTLLNRSSTAAASNTNARPSTSAAPIVSRLRLLPLKLDSAAAINISTKQGGYTLEVENTTTNDHFLSCTHNPNSLNGLTWKISTDSVISAVTGNEYWIIALCDDATIHVFNMRGSYSFPPLVVSSQISRMRQKGEYFIILTVKAFLYAWNLSSRKSLLKNESILSLINQPNSNESGKNNEVLDINLTSNGQPLVYISNGKTFMYCQEMQSWMQFSDPCGPVSSALRRRIDNGMFFEPNFNATADSKRSKPASILSNVKLRLATALELGNNEEIRHCLLVYAKTLAKQELLKELRMFCGDLLGPTFSGSSSSNWQPLIAGISKRGILQQVLTDLLKEGLQWQDFYTEFKSQLDQVQNNGF